jgi:hypothetical protein
MAVEDPLPSWNEGATKTKIITFVQGVTAATGKNYLPPADRIAVFDNDGTLWSEQPMYVQLAFAIDRVKTLALQHPEWREREPFKSILAGDIRHVLAGGETEIGELVMATHAGMTSEEFSIIARDWLITTRHPITRRLYTAMVYQPMLELLTHLRANDFKVYIVSAGGIEFLRAFSEQVYGVPPEQIIGSSIKTRYELQQDKPVILRLAQMDFIDEGSGKPVAIQKFIGRRPIAAFGNSDGDLEMLEWATGRLGPSFAMIIHHTDDTRESAYDRSSHVGRLDKALDAAAAREWAIADMKVDWRTVYP